MGKKVALVTCYFQKNYGSMLQAYATQIILNNLGVENETICIDGLKKEINKRKYLFYGAKIFSPDIVAGKFGYVNIKLRKKLSFTKLGKNLKVRDESFRKFEERFVLSKKYSSFDELSIHMKEYDAVIVGSDQLWLPSNLAADYYTLNWVPDDIRKISYATSFGVGSLDAREKEVTKNFINRFDKISVREDSGKKILEELTEKEIQIVCDPTLLLSKLEWSKEIKEIRLFPGKYIFCYFLGDNPDQRNYVKKLAEKTGCKIVAALHLNVYVKSDNNFADYAPFNMGPEEFVNYIRFADYVCTDSFHATVFSLIHGKNFFTFRRFKDNYTLSTNSRLDSFLKQVDLEDRIMSCNRNVDEIMNLQIDYDAVNRKLDLIREYGLNFLKDALFTGSEINGAEN